MKAIEAGADNQQQPRSPGVAKPPPNNATSYTPPSAEINFNNNNNASAIANIHGHANSEIYNGDTPSPVTVGGYASSELLDEESASLRPIIGYQRRRSGSGGARFFKPRGSPRPQGHGQQGRKYGTPPERTPSNRAMTRPEQLIRQECRLKRQNSDPSPGTKRKPKLEIFPPPSPSPNHNSSTELYTQPSSPIYPKNVDEDLLKVPFRCGASPSVGSFQSDPESCLDGLQFQYSTTYGEEDDDYEDPFSIEHQLQQ